MAHSSSAASWQLDAAEAAAYERCLVTHIFRPWAVELVNRAGLRREERLLDLACGTGVIAICVAARIGPDASLYAVDLNPEMLDLARKACSRAGVGVQFRIGNAEQLPFAGGSLDVVICQQGIQYFKDRDRVAREIARVLCERGRIVASVWRGLEHNPWAEALMSAAKDHGQVDLATALRRPFSLTDAAAVFDQAGFTQIATETVRIELMFPDPVDFFSGMLESLPGASAGLPAHARTGIAVSAARYLGSVPVPSEASIVFARKG
jgi:ubiquinone/menaquinone biosynthesis C-methylase UbiE